MKNTIIVILILITMTSCVEVLFEQPQPMGIRDKKEFPKSLHGTYVNEKDTLVISALQLNIPDDSKDSVIMISSDFVLRKYKGYFVANFKQDNGLWEVGFIKPAKDGKISVFTFEGNNQKKMEEMKKLTNVKTNYNEEGKIHQVILVINLSLL